MSIFDPGIVRVDALQLENGGGFFVALYTALDGGAGDRDTAHLVAGDQSRIELTPSGLDAGEYDVRILASASIDGATVAVPIDGALTVDPR